jgi:MFS family permease
VGDPGGRPRLGYRFLDSTVVNVALPEIGDDLGGGLSGLQWTLDGYLLTLSSLLLLGGAFGERRHARPIGTHALLVLVTQIAGSGAIEIVPRRVVMCDRAEASWRSSSAGLLGLGSAAGCHHAQSGWRHVRLLSRRSSSASVYSVTCS